MKESRTNMKELLSLPKLYQLKQRFHQPEIQDIPAEIHNQLGTLDLKKTIKPGQSVAITAGSRGIRHIDVITKTVVDEIKSLGARPFIIPAMGSHGGGTAEGQLEVLSGYGITEETMGCPVKSSMETVIIGKTRLGTNVYLDRFAAEADHIGVVNRIKPHTKLIGEIESGLLKMCLIGLGKRDGARTYHRAADYYSWMEILESVADIVIKQAPISFGLGLIQNAQENIGKIIGMLPQEFYKQEKQLLRESREMMGKLPFKDVDLLIVDEMGKDISGTGMDTNITGRKDDSTMKVIHLFVRDLTPATHGNAQGIGLADFSTKRLVDKIDFNALYINSLTAHRTDSCKIPMYFDTDYEVLQIATEMAGIEDPAEYKLIWIKNTLELETVYISEAYRKRIADGDTLEITNGPVAINFNGEGNLVSPFTGT
jgi:hypothetical protein